MSQKNKASTAAPNTKIVACPGCGGDSVYAPSNPFRPFCSAHCKNIDFGAWAAENFRVPSEAPPDDQVFGDARLQ
jgi:endogenous inhibitor of DNA gyrase (YacG/DUF329 family)